MGLDIMYVGSLTASLERVSLLETSVSFFWVQLNQITFGLVLVLKTKPFHFWFSFSFKKLNWLVCGLVLVLKS